MIDIITCLAVVFISGIFIYEGKYSNSSISIKPNGTFTSVIHDGLYYEKNNGFWVVDKDTLILNKYHTDSSFVIVNSLNSKESMSVISIWTDDSIKMPNVQLEVTDINNIKHYCISDADGDIHLNYKIQNISILNSQNYDGLYYTSPHFSHCNVSIFLRALNKSENCLYPRKYLIRKKSILSLGCYKMEKFKQTHL